MAPKERAMKVAIEPTLGMESWNPGFTMSSSLILAVSPEHSRFQEIPNIEMGSKGRLPGAI